MNRAINNTASSSDPPLEACIIVMFGNERVRYFPGQEWTRLGAAQMGYQGDRLEDGEWYIGQSRIRKGYPGVGRFEGKCEFNGQDSKQKCTTIV